jgi:hypothetical protein
LVKRLSLSKEASVIVREEVIDAPTHDEKEREVLSKYAHGGLHLQLNGA